jgi:Flp pilus assembly protein protease CpaA|tara:strand:- start:13395 stop:13802 length:408 start_codon:yes stop_codon:yes gene_type:complete
MISFWLEIGIVLVILLVASIGDIRKGVIQHWQPAFLMGVGLVKHSVNHTLAVGLAGAGVAFLIGFLLWQVKAFGAGDSKILIGLGFVFGFTPSLNTFLLCIGASMILASLLRKYNAAGIPYFFVSTIITYGFMIV